jgi:hypothetical protein
VNLKTLKVRSTLWVRLDFKLEQNSRNVLGCISWDFSGTWGLGSMLSFKCNTAIHSHHRHSYMSFPSHSHWWSVNKGANSCLHLFQDESGSSMCHCRWQCQILGERPQITDFIHSIICLLCYWLLPSYEISTFMKTYCYKADCNVTETLV